MKNPKVTFTLGNPDPKKHSTRFDFSELEVVSGDDGDVALKDFKDEPARVIFVRESGLQGFKPTFYVPAPFMNAKRLRITIEELN